MLPKAKAFSALRPSLRFLRLRVPACCAPCCRVSMGDEDGNDLENLRKMMNYALIKARPPSKRLPRTHGARLTRPPACRRRTAT